MHDRAATRRDHVGEHLLGEDHRRDQVEVERPPDRVELLLLRGGAAEEVAGRVHEDLGRTEPVDDLRHDAAHRVEVEEIAGDRDAVDLLAQVGQPVGPSGHDRDARAQRGEAAGDARAQPGGRAGDDGHPTLEVEPPERLGQVGVHGSHS